MEKYKLKSERIRNLREIALSSTPAVCIERARYLTEAYKKNEAQPFYIKRAKAIENILKNMSIYIKNGELLVGNRASKEKSAPVFPEYSIDWIKREIIQTNDFNQGEQYNFYISKKYKKELLEILDYWKDRNLYDKCMAILPQEVKDANEVNAILMQGNMNSGDDHIVPDFEKVIKVGINGIIKEAEERLAKINLEENDALRQKALLDSIIIINKSIISFGKRYAELANDLSQKEKNPIRREELQKISNICEKIPAEPPENFYEAVQMIWFIYLVLQIENNGYAISPGRIDQYLYPFFILDIKKGVVTREFAKELLQCLWIKLNSIINIRETSKFDLYTEGHTYQNITISSGGINYIGHENDFNYVIIESIREMKLRDLKLSVRINRNTPDEFLNQYIEFAGNGFNITFHNDEIIVPMMMNKGVKNYDALNYAIVGKIGVTVPGKWGYMCTGMTHLNLMKIFELTINDGFDMRTGITMLSGNGRLRDFESYDDLRMAWKKNIEYYTKLSVVLDKVVDAVITEFPDILCSSLVNSCINRCLTVKEGGAIYDIVSGVQEGITNVANSFAALKKVIFEKKYFTTEQIEEVLGNDFRGIESEMIRNILNNQPKCFNDNSYADSIAVDIYNSYINEISKYKNTRRGKGPIGGGYGLSIFGSDSNSLIGRTTGATPDGRNAWMPSIKGAGIIEWNDKSMDVLVSKNTISKLCNLITAVEQVITIRASSICTNNEVEFEKIISIIKHFVFMKGWHLQFNNLYEDSKFDKRNIMRCKHAN